MSSRREGIQTQACPPLPEVWDVGEYHERFGHGLKRSAGNSTAGGVHSGNDGLKGLRPARTVTAPC